MPRSFRFRTKLNLGIIVIVGVTCLIVAAVTSRMAAKALLAESRRSGSVQAENLAMRAVSPLLSADLLNLKDLVDELPRVDDHIVYAFILDSRGSVVAHTFTGGFPPDLLTVNGAENLPEGARSTIMLLDTGREFIYDIAAPVTVAGQQLGTVHIGLSRNRTLAAVDRLILAVMLIAGGAFTVALIVSAVFARHITRRINSLRRFAEDVVKGNYETESLPKSRNRCWEERDCDLVACPAHGNRSHRCWLLAGDDSCRECAVYNENRGDEIQELTETFEVMAHALREHIHELTEAEQNLMRQQRLTRTILDVSPDRVSLVDENLVYLAANRTFAESIGRRVEEIEGRRVAELHAAPEAERIEGENRKVLRSGRVSSKERRITVADEDHWFHVVRVPVHDVDGGVIGVMRSARDITEMKRVQEQLIQSQKLESIGKLAGGVAHEINTPLGIILGYAQLLKEDFPADGQEHQDLAIIEKQARVCRKIVADLLGFSRQTASEKLEMCFNNSVMEVVTLVRHAFSLENVTIVTDLDDRMPIIFGDPEKLKQVWINLLNNALSAMGKGPGISGDLPVEKPDAQPSGGGIVYLRSRLDTPNMKVSLWIADTGSGISPENQRRIFDPFFTTRPVGQGTGLGLSVSFGIIEEHGGEIHVQSPLPEELVRQVRKNDMPEDVKPGPGTVFIVDLPLDHDAMMTETSPTEKPTDPETAETAAGQGA